jgi:hypothetical protein
MARSITVVCREFMSYAAILVIGVSATVFVIGALTGAGIAAWTMPPV